MLNFEKFKYSSLSQEKLVKVSGGFSRSGYNFGRNVRHIADAIGSLSGIRSFWKYIR